MGSASNPLPSRFLGTSSLGVPAVAVSESLRELWRFFMWKDEEMNLAACTGQEAQAVTTASGLGHKLSQSVPQFNTTSNIKSAYEEKIQMFL